jgi:hypothetical protein
MDKEAATVWSAPAAETGWPIIDLIEVIGIR